MLNRPLPIISSRVKTSRINEKKGGFGPSICSNRGSSTEDTLTNVSIDIVSLVTSSCKIAAFSPFF